MPVTITVRRNGPLRIEGDFTVVDADGKPFDLAGRTAMSFCRCGHSTNKPFCDGNAHKECGFASVVAARVLAPPAPKPGA